MSVEEKMNVDFCLLIPYYNNFEGLIESLKSVIYPEDKFLILVIDDGSVQPLEIEKIKKEIGEKKALTILHNEQNMGITKTLNKGLAWIENNIIAKYIARLDCGDICSADRFIIQVNYMNTHPEIGLMGSWCRFIDEKSKLTYSYKSPSQHTSILKGMYFKNVFMHASVIFKTNLLKQIGYYPVDFEYAEDYAFFWKLILVNQSFVIDKYLITCKVNRNGISFKNKGKQLVARWKVVKAFSTKPLLCVAAFLRLMLLFILPKELLLQLKRMKG
ncbi:MAG TPA: glycosyltransferase [Chitinophagaceae bacterium]